jgi:hypothetical protein
MLRAEAMRTQGLCVSIVQLPRGASRPWPALSPSVCCLGKTRPGSPAGPAYPQADRRHGGGGEPWGHWGSAGAVEYTGNCHMSDTGEHDDHGVDQAHVTQDLPQVIAVPPDDEHDGHAGGPRCTSGLSDCGIAYATSA